MRWSFELQRHSLVVKHRPGKLNLLPDLLSRPATAEPQSLAFADVAHMHFATHIYRLLNLGNPKGQNPSLQTMTIWKSVHRDTPRSCSWCSGTRLLEGRYVTRTAFPYHTLHRQPIPIT